MGSARAQKETEAKRLHVLEEIEAKRRSLALERELTELRARVEAATLELGWKEQEAELRNVLEDERVKMQEDAAIQRLDLRRSGDDTVIDIKPQSKRRPV